MRSAAFALTLALVALCLVAGAAGGSEQAMLKLVPGAGALPGWKKLDADSWGDKDEAFFKILNGGAEEYTNAGGREIAYRAFKREKKILQATVIDMTDWQKSKAFYAKRGEGFANKPGRADLKIKNAGFSCIQGATTCGYLWTGRYYAELNVNGASPAEVEALQKAARLIAAEIRKQS